MYAFMAFCLNKSWKKLCRNIQRYTSQITSPFLIKKKRERERAKETTRAQKKTFVNNTEICKVYRYINKLPSWCSPPYSQS